MNRKRAHHPFALRLLRWFCPDHLREEIEGDLIQKYHRDLRFSESMKQAGHMNTSKRIRRRANRRLLWNVIRFARPGIILRTRISFQLSFLSILGIYFSLAWRSLARNKVFSFVNLIGLSISMVACLLIYQYVRFEFSYDRFHIHAPDIYRVATEVTLQDDIIAHETNTYDGIYKALKTLFPEVVAATSVQKYTDERTFIRYKNAHEQVVPLKRFQALEVDSTFFSVFSFELASGNPNVVLRYPYSAVISETIATDFFGGNAIGKILEVDNGDETNRYTITGIIKDVPPASHIKFDLLIRSEARTKNFWNGDVGFWDWGGQTYVLLDPNADPLSLAKKLGNLALSKNGLKSNKDDYGQVSTFELQRLLDIHLHSHLQEELEHNGSSALVYSLASLAVVILIIAWVNYVNLATAISEEKIRSIGVKKVVGASRGMLMLHILSETALFNIIAVVIAFLCAPLLLPHFASFAAIPLDYRALYAPRMLLAVIAFIVISTITAGTYPSLVAASFEPVRALKGRLNQRNGFALRKVLVVFQFTAALLLVITTVVVYQQLSFMRKKELGLNIDQVIVIKALNFDREQWSDAGGGFIIDSAYSDKVRLFKEEIRSRAPFLQATSLSHIPGQLPNWGTEFKAESNDPLKAVRLVAMGIDYDFLSTFQVKLLAGRNFSPAYPSDRGNEGQRAVVLNEAACKLLGFKTPQDAIHQHISTYWNADYEIIGVVNSFHQLSVKENLQPIYFILQPRALDYFAVRYQGENAGDAVQQAESIWHRIFPDIPFNYFLLDQYFDRQYDRDRQFRDIMSLFSGLAILVACLGLFGLTAYAIVQRTKEIGIRKVLGATVGGIIELLTRDVIRLILIASAIALPLAYLALNRWLENYAFRIELSWWAFVIPPMFVLVLAQLTLILQTVKVAIKNPVESLKQE